MKIVSWNIGCFILVKTFLGKKHYSFQPENLQAVVSLLKKEHADVLFLQEIEQDDIELLRAQFPEFRYAESIHTGERASSSLFLSIYPIQEVAHTDSFDYVIHGVQFFPVHLHAFSPERRYQATRKMLRDIPEHSGIILGDVNFWILGKRFLSGRDKLSYNKITDNHIDILKELGSTSRIFLSLDKIFVTNDIVYSEQKIVKHKIPYMDHYMISTRLDIKKNEEN
jgi:endonuclease/exonuclease/phosphatase family metal-dependent hydrolase